MNPEPPPISEPHSTHSRQVENAHPKGTRSPLRTLLWGVMSFVCPGMDAFLLILLVFFRVGSAPETPPYFLSPYLLIVLLLTWFSLRQCFRSD